jgi:hypothetical protein
VLQYQGTVEGMEGDTFILRTIDKHGKSIALQACIHPVCIAPLPLRNGAHVLVRGEWPSVIKREDQRVFSVRQISLIAK